jgi:hypothetical protein
LREGGIGSGGGGRTTEVACNGAFRPQAHHPSTCQHCAYNIRFVDSVKGEEEGDGRGAVCVSVHLILHSSCITDFICRSWFPLCDSYTIAGIPCLTELWKNGTQRMLCDRCQQWKMVCHWDLVGVMGPRDPNTPKWACCEGNLTDLRRILHLSLAKGNPKLIYNDGRYNTQYLPSQGKSKENTLRIPGCKGNLTDSRRIPT